MSTENPSERRFAEMTVQEELTPTLAEKWFKEQAKEDKVPLAHIRQDGPRTFFTLIKVNNNRSQKIYLEFPKDPIFGNNVVLVYTVVWEGVLDQIGHHNFSNKLIDSIAYNQQPNPFGDWQIVRTKTDKLKLILKKAIPFTEKLEFKECVNTIFDLGEFADTLESILGLNDADNY